MVNDSWDSKVRAMEKIKIPMIEVNNKYEKIFSLKSIAVVGMSLNPERASHKVAIYLQKQEYSVIPINPLHTEIANEKCYPSLVEYPDSVDIVDVFRKSDFVLPIAEDAIKIGAKVLWLQDGVINNQAKEIAEKVVKEAFPNLIT